MCSLKLTFLPDVRVCSLKLSQFTGVHCSGQWHGNPNQSGILFSLEICTNMAVKSLGIISLLSSLRLSRQTQNALALIGCVAVF